MSIYLSVGGDSVLLDSGSVATSAACCCVTGACCVGTDCTIETETNCTGMGGIYQGDDTTCDPNPCMSGACCATDGDCSITSETDCITGGGTYQGDGTSCSPNPCVCQICVHGYAAFDGSGRRFMRYQRSISGHFEFHEACGGPDLLTATADCSATYEAHIPPDCSSAVVDIDTSSSSRTGPSMGETCSHPILDCFCSVSAPGFNVCTGAFNVDSYCGVCTPSGGSDVTVNTATTRTRIVDFTASCSSGGGCNCNQSGSYVEVETLSDECI